MEYGELGWIEIEGFPFWPARRGDVLEVSADVQKLGREGLVLVYFFGSHAYGWMEPEKIRPWDDNFEKFTSVGRKGKLFQQALEEAYEWQKESYKKVPTRRRAQMKQRPPDLPSHLLPEKKKHEQALKQMMDLREKEWNKEQKKTKKERGEEVSESKEESVASKKSVGRPGRKPKKAVEKKQESDASDRSGSDSDSFVVKGYEVEDDNEDSEDDGLAIFRKELQREFKKDSPLPATSDTKEPFKAAQAPQAENKPVPTQMIDLAQNEPETQQRVDVKLDLNIYTNGVAQAVNKTPTKPTPNIIRRVPPPCPDCGRKSKILLKSQVPSTSTDHRRKEASECADSSLGIYLFYMLENHVHNLHDGFKPFKCIYPGCADAFFTEFALRDHIDNQHADFFHLHDSFPRPIMIADQMNLSQDNEDRKENYMDVDEGAKLLQQPQQAQQANPNAMEIEPNNSSADELPKLEPVTLPQQPASRGPQAEQFNSVENSAEDTAAKNLVNESDDDFDALMEKLKHVNNDTLRCEYPGCEKIFIGFSARADRRKHVEISHLGLKRKPCDDCGRGVYNSLGSDRKRKFQGGFAVKRGRGRPRKYPRPNEYPMAHTTSIISASNMPMNGNAGSSLSNLVIKRGRGRPRKYPRPDEPSTGNSPILQGMQSSAPISINMSGGFQRRGPGRPRKYPLANSPSDPHSPVSSSPVISPINDMHMVRHPDMPGGLPMKKRKGPGRPRKYPRLEGDAHSSQDVNSESEGTPVITKKKPGYNLAQEAMFRNMAGVPGRPKQPNPFDPKAKRGRGRPRKTDQRREGDYSGPSSAEGSDNEEWGGEGYSSGNEGDISDDEGVRRRRRIGGGPGRPKKPRGSDSDWNPPSYLKKTTIDYSAFFDPNNPNRAADIKNFMSSPVALNLPPNIIAQMQSMQVAAANNTPATASGQETDVGLFVDLVDLCEAEYSRRQPPPGVMPGVNMQPQYVNNSNAAPPNVNNNTNTNVNSFNRQF